LITITGATGHIGNVLVRELLSKKEKIRVIVPPGEDIKPLDGLDIEIISGDVRDINTMIPAFQGADKVYHLAGIISILPGKRDLLQSVNVQGTRNVVEACLKTGIKRLVYVSSIHAIKEPPHGTIITESQPYDPSSVLGDYAKSKAQATLEVIHGVEKGLDTVIVCPTGVIGPYDYKVSEMGHLILEFLLKKIKACVDGAYDFVDVRDVVRGMILASEKGRTGEGYILSGEQITIRDLYSLLENITNIKAPKFQVSCGIARAVGVLATPYYILSKTKPLFTKYSIDVLASNSLVSSEKAKRELGYSARPINESLADAIIWFKEQMLGNYKGNSERNPAPA
jgi:dihydroflavonol-4-reductase